MSARKRGAAKKTAPATPREARTTKALVALPRDNISFAGFWFMLSESTVTITAQRSGEASTGQVRVPRRVFDKIVDWYNGVEVRA